MELEFISNTGAFLSYNGRTIGMDPWLTQGAFEGSWYHYPPLRKTRSSIADCDAIYISHIHPDHCDFNALSEAREDCIFIVPAYFNHLLKRKLEVFGYTNVISLSDYETATLFDEIEIKLFGQFVKSLGSDEAKFGSLIDTALLLSWDGRNILNCNDNYLDVDSAKTFIDQHPHLANNLDYVMLPHSASGPYPACFLNLSEENRRKEAVRLQREYVSLFVETTKILAPKIVSPTAAEYVIVGSKYERNEYIGTAPASAAVKAWKDIQATETLKTEIVELDCGTILDIDTGQVFGLPVRSYSMSDKMAFAEKFRHVTFRYQWEDTCTDAAEFDRLIRAARSNLWNAQKRLQWFKDYDLVLNIDNRLRYHFNFQNEEIALLPKGTKISFNKYLVANVSIQLIYSIITGRVHWNNAEGGLHIDFYRKPDIFIPEVYVLMSFFKS